VSVASDAAQELLERFCDDLRLLWTEAGGPTLRALAGRVSLSKSQVSNILAGRVRQPPDWQVVSALVTSFARFAHERGRARDLSVSTAVDEFWRPRHTVVEHAHRQAPRARPARAARPADAGSGPARSLSARSGPAWSVPRQLPATVPYFVGRTNELETLTKLIDDGDAGTVVISAIAGAAGIGKTALAIQWAHGVVDRFPDGQLYLNLRGFDPTAPPLPAAEALRTLLEALAVAPERIPTTPDAMAGLYRTVLVGKRILVILDNARDTEQVRPLLPGTSTAFVLVTSRNRLTSLVVANGARPITLDALSRSHARDLLTGRLGHDRAARDGAAIDEIIASCARLPLALSIVAARAATYPNLTLGAMAAELRDTSSRLDALDAGDLGADVRSAFSWSYQRLRPPAARLFRRLGLHPGPDLDAAVAASLDGQPDVARQLAELTQAHLITEPAHGRYTLHDLLRAYAAELARADDGEAERADALRRMLDHYVATAQAAGALLNPTREAVAAAAPDPAFADRDEALAWFTVERPALVGAVTLAAESGFAEHACQLAWIVSGFLHLRGRWPDRAQVQRTALAAAQRAGDRLWQARIHRDLTGALAWLDEFADSLDHAERAIALHAEMGDELGLARTHRTVCLLMERWGRYERALEHARASRDLFLRTDDRTGQAYAFNSVGWYQTLVGSYRDALDNCRRAVDLLGSLGDRGGEANAWDSLGYAHHHLGDEAEAIRCYRRAIALLSDVGDRYFEARSLDHLGDAHHALGDHEDARAAWRRCLTILDELQPSEAESVRAKLGGRPRAS
jgi:tetratricopeptide (TPR) repeat protein